MADTVTQILPDINASGVWTLKTPFKNYLKSDTWYTCVAVRKIEDYTALGLDPYELYYKSFSITKEQYEKEVALGACIITVRSSAGVSKQFPSTYLSSFPSGGGVIYQNLALAVDIGPVAESKDLTNLLTKMQDMVKTELGVDSTAKTIALSTKQLLDRESHERIEAARPAKTAVVVVTESKVEELSKENAELRSQIAELEKHIIGLTKK